MPKDTNGWTVPAKKTRAGVIALAVLSLVGVALWLGAWPVVGGVAPRLAYQSDDLVFMGGAEARFFLGALAVQVPLMLLVVTRLSEERRKLSRLESWALEKPVWGYVLASAFAFLVTVLIAGAIVHFTPLTEDEKTYLFQATLLRSGSLSAPLPRGGEALMQPFLVAANGHWTGQFFWAQPALLAVGQAVGSPWLMSSLEVGAAVFFTGVFVAEYTQDRRTGLLASVLLATSPILLLTGGTLHNANLAVACAAASLWGLTHLVRRDGRIASIVLGVSTAVGIHNRVLDHFIVLLIAGGIASYVSIVQGQTRALIRRLLPAVGIVAFAVAALLMTNRAVSGAFFRSGYHLFNDKHGWITMGFGKGPFGLEHNPVVAAAKTLTVLWRMLFYVTGTPLLVVVPLIGIVAFHKRRWLPPMLLTGAYACAYFLYAHASTATTGPVYYLALTPVLVGWIAHVLIGLQDRVGPDRPSFVRPLVIGGVVASVLVFWPAQLVELARAGRDAGACGSVVERAGIRAGLVFVAKTSSPKMANSWAHCPPMPDPWLKNPIVFVRSRGRRADRELAMMPFAEGRQLFFADCVHAPHPTVRPYAP